MILRKKVEGVSISKQELYKIFLERNKTAQSVMFDGLRKSGFFLSLLDLPYSDNQKKSLIPFVMKGRTLFLLKLYDMTEYFHLDPKMFVNFCYLSKAYKVFPDNKEVEVAYLKACKQK